TRVASGEFDVQAVGSGGSGPDDGPRRLQQVRAVAGLYRARLVPGEAAPDDGSGSGDLRRADDLRRLRSQAHQLPGVHVERSAVHHGKDQAGPVRPVHGQPAYPKVMRLALPPAAAVLTLSETSSSRPSNR